MTDTVCQRNVGGSQNTYIVCSLMTFKLCQKVAFITKFSKNLFKLAESKNNPTLQNDQKITSTKLQNLDFLKPTFQLSMIKEARMKSGFI